MFILAPANERRADFAPDFVSAQSALSQKLRGSSLVEDHHLGDEGVDPTHRHQPAARSQGGKILPQIAAVVRLMKILRKELEHSVVSRLVSKLERVNDHQPTSALEHSSELAQCHAPHFRRQLMKGEDAR